MRVEAKYLSVERRGQIFIITLNGGPENRLHREFCDEIRLAFHDIHRQLGPDSEGAVITQGNNLKFFCTGVDLEKAKDDSWADPDGFFPMLHTILDFPYPTIACITGHTFGGGCLFSFAHDYRVMNADRGYFSMVPVDFGLHFDGIGALPKAKLSPQIARKVLLEAYRFTGKEALQDGVVDSLAPADKLLDKAIEYADKWKAKSKMNVYGLLRSELVGEAVSKLKAVSYVHSRRVSRQPPDAKL